MKKRDLTKAQFEYRARKLGCTPEGFMGYWKLPGAGHTAVSILNAGRRRRDQLRYLQRAIKRKQLDADNASAIQIAENAAAGIPPQDVNPTGPRAVRLAHLQAMKRTIKFAHRLCLDIWKAEFGWRRFFIRAWWQARFTKTSNTKHQTSHIQ